MGQSILKGNPRKIFSQAGTDPSLVTRVTNLENNVYKVTYYEIISGASGSITIPTGATINAGEFGLSGNCILSEIDGSNKPIYISPVTAGGVVVTSSLNTTTGAWVKSGVTTSANVALIYSVNISALNYSNLNTAYIIDTVQKDDIVSQTITNGDTYHAPSSDAVNTALDLKVSKDSQSIIPIFVDLSQSSALTGTVSITKLKSALIPANTIITNDEVEIRVRAEKNNATGTSVQYLYHNTSDSLGGATLLATQSSVARFYGMSRILNVSSSNQSNTIAATVSVGFDDTANAASKQIFTMDWTLDNYIIQAFQLAATTDICQSFGLTIKRTRF